jgi:hypothetical protein
MPAGSWKCRPAGPEIAGDHPKQMPLLDRLTPALTWLPHSLHIDMLFLKGRSKPSISRAFNHLHR